MSWVNKPLLSTPTEFNLDAVHTILQTKAKRDLSLKIFDYGKVDSASGNRVRQEIKLKKGISQEIAKQIKLIRDEFKRCKPRFRETRCVSSKTKRRSQLVMQRLKQEDWPAALQLTIVDSRKPCTLNPNVIQKVKIVLTASFITQCFVISRTVVRNKRATALA